jgi:UDP-glucuronate 4-epimerase
VSLYAATKKANELMAHTYSHLFGLPTTGLRFFTVYGPWGRPDMALFTFTKAIAEGRPIDVYNHGEMVRDFTYIDDIAEGVLRVLDRPASYRVFNIGNSDPVPLMSYIEAIESALGIKARKNFLPLQPGEMVSTFADVSELAEWTGFRPRTGVREGVQRFVAWYRDYFKLFAEELQ